MSYNPSILHQLRAVVPARPLGIAESYRIAELQANRLLEWGAVDAPSTPSELVTDLPFIQVVNRADLPVSGSAQWVRPRWVVLLNMSEPPVRRRFSLMHEFKHILDDPFIEYLYPHRTDAERHRHAEHVADAFAACVLMPKRLVKRLWGQGVHDFDDLAVRFEVSTAAMRYRVQELGLATANGRCAGRPFRAGARGSYSRALSARSPVVVPT
jgi:Zn-dependent peptidase ImmA (M78 family)